MLVHTNVNLLLCLIMEGGGRKEEKQINNATLYLVSYKFNRTYSKTNGDNESTK